MIFRGGGEGGDDIYIPYLRKEGREDIGKSAYLLGSIVFITLP